METVELSVAGRHVTFQLQPYLLVAAAALTLAYTIIGWNDPTFGLHKTLWNKGNDFGLAVAVVILNSLVALVALSNIGSIMDLAAGGTRVGLSVTLSMASVIVMGAAAVSIANATTVRRKRGDALGISAVVLSGLSIIGPVMVMMGGAQNVLRSLV